MKYTKGPIIGRGSTATVSLATTATGRLFAVKSSNLSNSSFLQKEQQILSKLSSPYIIKYIGFDTEYNLLMEYAPGGTISDVIKKQGGSLEESLIRSYTHQILLGLDYLHSNNLVHCDVKCANMLVCEDGIKIGDLGCTKLAEDTSSVLSGTPVFMAPEVARGEKQGFAADVWAVGCAVIEMATGCNPWPEMKDPVSGLYRIGYSGDVPVFPVCLSEEGKDFLEKCLRRNDEERWSAKELLEHPFVNSNLGSKKIETLRKDSPISVLEQCFWDSLELIDSPASKQDVLNFCGRSPVERVRELVGVNSGLPDWVEGEDWITVRSNHVDESWNVIDENLYANADMEDDDSESTRSDSELFLELYVEEEFAMLVRILTECNVVESSDAGVVNSRFLDFKNTNNNNNDNCFLIDSNQNFCIIGSLPCIFKVTPSNGKEKCDLFMTIYVFMTIYELSRAWLGLA